MCGIAGIYGLEGIADPKAVIRRMTDRIAHRGPDAEGVWLGEEVVFGHRRLSIIDPGHSSDQPFLSADGNYSMVFNGEIYNYRELRSELEKLGHSFRTNGDTEVLLAAFIQWKEQCLPKLIGMFAFAIHDRLASKLFIARDRLGIKPLYFHHGDRHFLFASELRSILASDLVERKLDHTAFIDHLRYATVHAPRTIVRDVQLLLPGHFLTISDDQLETVQWWDVNRNADRSAGALSIEEVRSGIKERLVTAVERRLVADVPLGAFLSGGIDSTAIVGCMADLMDRPVRTFSVVFDEEEFSEETYSSAVAKKFKTDHTVLRLRSNDLLHSLPNVLAAMDHPSGDGANTWMVSKATRGAGVTVALSGLGGDELFAGYPVFKHIMQLWEKRWLTQFPVWTRAIGRSLLSRLDRRFRRSAWSEALLLDSFTIDSTYPLSRLLVSDRELHRLLRQRQLPANAVNLIMHKLIREQGAHDLPFLSQVSAGELLTYLPNVLLRDTDQMSMAFALEVRVPFLDHELVEFVLGVRDKLKYPHTPKQLLVEALGDLLPQEIVHRKKMGFVLPWEQWMRGDLRSFCEERLHAMGERSFFKPGAVVELWRSFLKEEDVPWFRLWSLVVLEDWLQRNRIAE
jgi:asparagine synthase (glutamine-hydrolysing)